MDWGRRLLLALAASVAATLLLAANAPAAFHLMKIREVYPGGAGGGSYVVLQMWTGGQNFVDGHTVVVYEPGGSVAHSFEFPGDVANGSNQATILLAGEGYAATFPGGPSPDFADAGLDIPSGGGAVCFPDGSPPDCVSWGNFSGDGSLPSSAGEPASPGGVSAGKALHRTIEPPCATLLEPGDDSDNSLTDFSERDPEPRSNSSAIVEGECVPPDETPPNTLIDTQPPNPSGSDVSFTYHASEAGSTFECSLSSGGGPDSYESCSAAGKSYPELADGEYTFKVRAEDSSGNLDPTPATYSWTVEKSAPDTTPPTVTIDSAPPDPSESSTASFTYSANEDPVSFECKLDGGSFAPCPASGKTYEGLGNGSHSFAVVATDKAENTSNPAGYSFDVVLPGGEPADSEPPPPSSPPFPSIASLSEPSPAPGSAIAAALARVKGAVALLKLRCRGPVGGLCRGAFRLLARTGGARGSRRARALTIGRGRYSLAVGTQRQVRARLTALGKRLVRRAGRRGLKVRLTGAGVVNRVVKLRSELRRKRARRGGRSARARTSAFHLVKIREVYPGAADSSYVVLQMLATGENFVGGRSLRVYDSAGTTLDTFTFSAGYAAPNANHGNNTILVGDTGVQSAFGVAPDDKADPNLDIPAAGGAVCWLDGQPPDCVSWGNFSGDALPVPGAGGPAAPLGIPPGMALRRTIAPSCPTFLEAADDTDSSVRDFFGVFPLPRPNSVPPPERPCSTVGGGGATGGAGKGDGGGGASPGTGPSRSRVPRTRIVRGPGRVTRDRTPTFRFRADRRASFRCRIDGRRARGCRSPFTWRRLRYGCHTFRVRARSGRSADRTPAVYRFRIVKRREPGLRQFRRCRSRQRR